MTPIPAIIAIVMLFVSGNAFAIPQIEREALIAVYESTDGDNWSRNDDWKTPPLAQDGFAEPGTECGWAGVTCQDNRVTAFNLANNGLTGAIPPEFGNLSNLERIGLGANQLTGSIPPELGNLSRLDTLSLSHNQLTGSIPSALGNLINLEWINLSANQLTGSIPSELGNMINLGSFYLAHNQLSGSIPPELGNLINLSGSIDLSNNQLTSIPPELGNLIKLRGLWLANNQLSGSIPPELGGLINLGGLWLTNNQLTGPIPPELGNLINLDSFYLSNNQFTSIPPELGNLAGLYNFDLSNNQLTGPIPPELGNLSFVEWGAGINLSKNLLTGSIPPELGNLSISGAINLSSNQLSGPIPPELGNLVGLNSLNLSNNQLSGPIPPELGNLSFAGWGGGIDLSNNQLSGPIPPELVNLTGLTDFRLSNNQLSGPIPPELGNLSFDNPATGAYFLLNNNQLSGPIPPELGNLSFISGNYAYIDLSNNQLSGPIPPEFANNIEGRYINLSNNQLTGPIPWEMIHRYERFTVDFSHNQFSGTIPPQIGLTSDLRWLYLNDNLLIGPVQLEFDCDDGCWPMFLREIHICNNYLYTEDHNTRDFLNHYQPGWEDCQYALPVFGVTPASKSVTANAGSADIHLANTGGGALHWTATVTSGGDWLSITSGSGGIDAGTVTCEYSQNTGGQRIGAIRFESVTEQSHDFQVTQAAATHTLTTAFRPISGGGVTINPVKPIYSHNEIIQLTANPSPGYAFSHWSGDVSGSSNPNFITMDTNKAAEANFLLMGQPNAIGQYRSVATLTPAERDFLLDIGGDTKLFPVASPVEEVRFQNDTATIYYRDGTSKVVNVKHGDGYSDDFINQVLLSETVDDTFTTLLNLPSFDAELEFPGNSVVICYPGISPVGAGPGIEINDLSLLKLKPVGQPSLPFAYRVNAPVDGDFWITNHLQEAVLPPTHTLNPGQVVDLYLAVDDNSLYDLDDTSNVIVDPLVLGQVEEQVLLPPAELSYPATSSTGSFTVSWSASTGAASYRLEYSTDGGNTWLLRYTGSVRSYAESVDHGSYRYRVMATDASGDSAWQTGTHDCVVSIQAQAESGDGGGGGGCFIQTVMPRLNSNPTLTNS